MEPIEVRVHEERGWTVVSVRGVVDVASALELDQALQEAQFGGSTKVLLDLDQIELLDSFGLSVVLSAHKRARSHDAELAVLVTRDRIREVIALAGLDRTLHLVADADEVGDA